MGECTFTGLDGARGDDEHDRLAYQQAVDEHEDLFDVETPASSSPRALNVGRYIAEKMGTFARHQARRIV